MITSEWFPNSYDVVTSEFVAIGLYIGNTSDFQIRFRLRESRSKYFVVASTVDQLKISFYSVEVACVQDTICVDGYLSRARADELSSHR